MNLGAGADGEPYAEPYVLADYDGACISNVVPALLEWPEAPAWLPNPVVDAEQVVLLVLDGLGWEQLQERRRLAPTLCAMAGGPITTIVPSTTAAALTSITTGLPPGEHGIVGYRIWLEADVLNILRWNSPRGDCRRLYVPEQVQPHDAFAGHRPPAVTRAEFAETGFTRAHLRGARFCGYRVTSTLVHHVAQLARRGEPFTYAYYEGIDKVAHEYGLGAGLRRRAAGRRPARRRSAERPAERVRPAGDRRSRPGGDRRPDRDTPCRRARPRDRPER